LHAALALLGAAGIGLSLGLLGSGGSILTVPVLVFLLGQPEKVAIAGSLAIVGTIAAIGAVPYALGRQIDWSAVWKFGAPGMAGTYAGAWLAHWIPGAVQLSLFAVVMLLAAWRMLRQTPPTIVERTSGDSLSLLAGGVGVGLLSGLVGIGGGFLIVPALVLFARLAIHRAIASSLAVIVLNSAAGFIKYRDVLAAHDLSLDWHVIVLFSAIGAAGSLLGIRLARRLSQRALRRGFGVFLVIMAAFVLYETAPRL